MTLEELCLILNKKESTIKTNFNRTNEVLKERYAIYISKERINGQNNYELCELYEGALERYLKSCKLSRN